MSIDKINPGKNADLAVRNRKRETVREVKGDAFEKVFDRESSKTTLEAEGLKNIHETEPTKTRGLAPPAFHITEQLAGAIEPQFKSEEENWEDAWAYIIKKTTPDFSSESEKTDFAWRIAEIKRWSTNL